MFSFMFRFSRCCDNLSKLKRFAVQFFFLDIYISLSLFSGAYVCLRFTVHCLTELLFLSFLLERCPISLGSKLRLSFFCTFLYALSVGFPFLRKNCYHWMLMFEHARLLISFWQRWVICFLYKTWNLCSSR